MSDSDIVYVTGNKQRYYRDKQGVTLEELSKESNVSSTLLSLFERNQYSLPADKVANIANALGVSVAMLIEPYKFTTTKRKQKKVQQKPKETNVSTITSKKLRTPKKRKKRKTLSEFHDWIDSLETSKRIEEKTTMRDMPKTKNTVEKFTASNVGNVLYIEATGFKDVVVSLNNTITSYTHPDKKSEIEKSQGTSSVVKKDIKTKGLTTEDKERLNNLLEKAVRITLAMCVRFVNKGRIKSDKVSPSAVGDYLRTLGYKIQDNMPDKTFETKGGDI